MLKAGQLVVCVNGKWATFDDDPPGLQFPIKDNIYTIRGFITVPNHNRLGLVFEEIINPSLSQWGHELAFISNHFRPIQKPSIECLRAFLVKPPQKKVLVKVH